MEAPRIDTGDTAWLLVSTALVFLMTPGLALFYGGMVRTKNVLSTIMHSIFALGIMSIAWVTVGYSLAFGSDIGGIIGGFDYVFLRGIGPDSVADGQTVPHLLFMTFQMMFAIITPALISGAYAERLKFSAYVVFSLLWVLLVYAPQAHWVWGGGFLGEDGALDFAGGTVVHINAGVSALIFALVLGKRKEKAIPHNLTMTVLGASFLWFGWFGFNAGSALGANGLASFALLNTQIAAAAGAILWTVVEVIRFGKPNSFGFVSGLVGGLVAITPAAGFVSPMGALAIGAVAGVICYGGVLLKERFGYDDSLDAFGVHGIGGIVGSLLTGVFARVAWNPDGADGLLAGNAGLMWIQTKATFISIAYAAIATFILLKIIDATIGLRVSADVESEGLDLNLHGERGYAMGPTTAHLEEHAGGHAQTASAPTASPITT